VTVAGGTDADGGYIWMFVTMHGRNLLMLGVLYSVVNNRYEFGEEEV